MSTKNSEKYSKEAAWPISMNGFSTGCPPIHVRITTLAMNVQNNSWVRGRNISPRCFDVCSAGASIRTKIDAKSAKTPPSLLGMDRRIA